MHYEQGRNGHNQNNTCRLESESSGNWPLSAADRPVLAVGGSQHYVFQGRLRSALPLHAVRHE